MDDLATKISLVFQFLVEQSPSFSESLQNINFSSPSNSNLRNCIIEFVPKSANLSTFKHAEMLARYIKNNSKFIGRIYRKLFNSHIVVIETDESLVPISLWPNKNDSQDIVEDMEM